jgi:hypothetical protein
MLLIGIIIGFVLAFFLIALYAILKIGQED